MEESALPIIDLGPWTIPGYKKLSKADVIDQVSLACETLGCFYLKNHGVDRRLIENTISDLRKFFAQPLAVKSKFIDPLGDVNRGYVGYEQQNLNAFMGRNGFPNDPLEKYLCAPPASDVTRVAENLWPDYPITFKNNVSEYYKNLKRLSETLLTIFSLALKIPGYEDFFRRQCEGGEFRLKNHFYHPNASKKDQQVNRFPEHTDSTPFALLTTDACRGALQVLDDRDGKWISADIEDGDSVFILNLGDSMTRWTNGRWVAPIHKVAWPDKEEEVGRLSIVYFAHANWGAMLESIPDLVPEGEKPKYEPISYSEYVNGKVNAINIKQQ